MADKKKIAILTSGGDAPGMNAAIRAVVRSALYFDMEVFGVRDGYLGLMQDEIEQLSAGDVGDIIHRGGTMLGTARLPEFATDPAVRQKCYENLRAHGIEGLVVCGGDGSYRGANLVQHEGGINVIGLPGTIDNDLGYTDYTIGFDTAVNTVLEAITKIRDTSSSHERTTVIEVMGRHCGDIALFAGLAGGAEGVLIPEIENDINELCKKIVMGANRGKQHSIIINAEGSGISSQELTETIQYRTGKDTRLVVLSYLQRGGSPTLRDRMLATLTGAKAVELLKDDSDSKAIGTVDGEIAAYDLIDALEQKREIDRAMYDLIGVLSK